VAFATGPVDEEEEDTFFIIVWKTNGRRINAGG